MNLDSLTLFHLTLLLFTLTFEFYKLTSAFVLNMTVILLTDEYVGRWRF